MSTLWIIATIGSPFIGALLASFVDWYGLYEKWTDRK
jgi:hypothetical protein